MTHHAIIDEHILSIIQNQDVEEQSDLQEFLRVRGFEIPQATLSRRLKKLKIAKVSGVYKAIDFGMPNLPLILNIQISEFGLVVLHTNPSQAQSLAYYIDQKYVSFNPRNTKESGILGTIAGDDTVLLIIKSRDSLPQIRAILQVEFPYLKI
jgi:transcriptional regulator of arginine metabolism